MSLSGAPSLDMLPFLIPGPDLGTWLGRGRVAPPCFLKFLTFVQINILMVKHLSNEISLLLHI